jgi:hypothetical protein
VRHAAQQLFPTSPASSHKAVRYQFTGDNKDKQRMRIEVTVFAYQGILYQVWVAGSLQAWLTLLASG